MVHVRHVSQGSCLCDRGCWPQLRHPVSSCLLIQVIVETVPWVLHATEAICLYTRQLHLTMPDVCISCSAACLNLDRVVTTNMSDSLQRQSGGLDLYTTQTQGFAAMRKTSAEVQSVDLVQVKCMLPHASIAAGAAGKNAVLPDRYLSLN